MGEPFQARLPGTVPVYRGPTGWPAIVDAFLDGYGGNTEKGYRRDLGHWASWCERQQFAPLNAVRADVQRYTREQLDGGASAATVKRRLSAIAGAYRWCEAEGLLERSPAALVRRPKVDPDSPTRGVDETEYRSLLTAARAAGTLEHALISLLGKLGVRVSEVCAANVADLAVQDGRRLLHVVRKGGKPRLLPLEPSTAAALDELLAGRRSGPLLSIKGIRLSRWQARRIVIRLADVVGIPPGVTTHSLRHGFATTALEHGAPLQDVQDAMDHADPRTTQRYNRARHRVDRNPTYMLGKLFDDDIGPIDPVTGTPDVPILGQLGQGGHGE